MGPQYQRIPYPSSTQAICLRSKRKLKKRKSKAIFFFNYIFQSPLVRKEKNRIIDDHSLLNTEEWLTSEDTRTAGFQ
jgi:hypothetical protein